MNDRSNTIKARLLRLFGHGSRPLNQDSKNKFDEPTAVLAAILLGIAGTGVAMGMPLFVGSLAESLGFNEQPQLYHGQIYRGSLFFCWQSYPQGAFDKLI